ncbi:MAG: phosphonate ABC transporter substrate-binding protein [Sedimenticola sp.]|nr:MAG: phosphonate ABC transporter substrate-binding protein [Sedimenticola sp.]
MKRRSLLIAGALSFGLATSVAFAESMKEINFGIISTESSQNLRTIWYPFLNDMGKKLDMKVNAYFAPDYAGIIEAMRFDKVDVAWYGNKSAMLAVDRAGGEIFAQTVDVDGNPGYWSLLLTHKDSGLTFEDVLNCNHSLTFGNGDPNSTSGNLVPGYYVFAQNNIDVKQCYKRVLNSNHETNALAVANKQVDFATNNTETMARIQKNFPEKYEELKIIWKSPLIPSDPIVWRKNLSDDIKAKLKGFFMTYGVKGEDVAKEKKVLADLQWAPFSESDNNQLLPIRQLELVKQRRKIENDTKYSQAEKDSKISEINGQLAELQKQMASLRKQ